MNCIKPYVGPHGTPYGCGQCTPCKINKRREWTGRINAEASLYTNVAFTTFTYNPENEPEGRNLVPNDLTQLYRRLERKLGHKIRHFSVGEYGDQTQRPHYHSILFGYPSCLRGKTRKAPSCCPSCDLLTETWGRGFVMVLPFSDEVAQYVSGYVVKKMTKPDDERLAGRTPEFVRPPRKPPCGAHFVDEQASVHLEHNLENLPDVISEIQLGKKIYPLGRTLKQRLRTRVGHSPLTPDAIKIARVLEAKPLWDDARAKAQPGHKIDAYRSALMDAAEGKRIQIEAKLRRSKRYL